MKNRFGLLLALVLPAILPAPFTAAAQPNVAEPVALASAWQLQDVAKAAADRRADCSRRDSARRAGTTATVPGTVLTTLVNDGVYPEPLYGENMRPEVIPESLAHTSYWYRTTVTVPAVVSGPARLAQF